MADKDTVMSPTECSKFALCEDKNKNLMTYCDVSCSQKCTPAPSKAQDATEEVILSQSIRELLYAFRKNGGDLDYCVKQVRDDFKKAGYMSLQEINQWLEKEGALHHAPNSLYLNLEPLRLESK